MAKQIGRLEIVIRGTGADGPQECVVRYQVEESTDTTLKGPLRDSVKEAPDFTKKFHDAGTAGEFWKDELDAVKAAEGIS